MKSIISIFVAGIFISASLKALPQQQHRSTAGLYLTADDYAKNNIKYEIKCVDKGEKIKWDILFNSKKVEVVRSGKKEMFNKKDLYGLRDCDDKEYRFNGNNACLILDTPGFYIYAHSETTQGKGYRPVVTQYYFSAGSNSPVQLLTVDNLKQAFPDNHEFHYLLDQVNSSRDLMGYDKYAKMYKIKYIYKQTLKKSYTRN